MYTTRSFRYLYFPLIYTTVPFFLLYYLPDGQILIPPDPDVGANPNVFLFIQRKLSRPTLL